MTAAKLDPALCRELAVEFADTPGMARAAAQLVAAADLAEECDLIALQFDAAGIDRTLPLAHQAQVLQEQHRDLRILLAKEREHSERHGSVALEHAREVDRLRADLAERKPQPSTIGQALDPDADLTTEQLDGMELWDRDVMLDERHRAVGAMLVRRAVAEIRRRRAQPTLTEEQVRGAVERLAKESLTSRGLQDEAWDDADFATDIAARAAKELAGRTMDPPLGEVHAIVGAAAMETLPDVTNDACMRVADRAVQKLAGAVVGLSEEVLRGLQLMRRHLDEGGHDWREGTAMSDVRSACEYLDRALGGPSRVAVSNSETCRMLAELMRRRAQSVLGARQPHAEIREEIMTVLLSVLERWCQSGEMTDDELCQAWRKWRGL